MHRNARRVTIILILKNIPTSAMLMWRAGGEDRWGMGGLEEREKESPLEQDLPCAVRGCHDRGGVGNGSVAQAGRGGRGDIGSGKVVQMGREGGALNIR